MIIFDTETTGLVQPESTPLDQQPRIIEFAAMKVDFKTLKEKDRITFKLNPGMPLPAIITKITGLTDKDLKNEPEFAEKYPELIEFFFGTRRLLAHNCPFDVDLLSFDLMRINKLRQFPWPPVHICTVDKTFHFNNKRMKLEALYKMAFRKDPQQTHRAMDDVELLYKVVVWLRKEHKII